MKTKRTLGFLLALIMCLSVIVPISTATAAEADATTVYYNDFSSGTVQTDVGEYVFAAQNYSPVVDNGALTVTKSGDAYVSLRPDNEGNDEYKNDGAAPLKVNMVLSFKIKLNSDVSHGTLKCGDNATDRTALEFLSINRGSLVIPGVGDVSLIKNAWQTVEVVFNYDESAQKFGSYTVLLNGKELNTIAITIDLKHVNSFELFRWGADSVSFAIDDFYYGFGTGNRGTDIGAELYGVDFEKMTTVPTSSAPFNKFRVMNNYDPASNTASTTKIQNGVLTAVNGGGQAFIDANADGTLGHLGDLTVSMQIRPVGTSWNGSEFLNVRHSNGNFNLIMFGNQNQVKIGDRVAALSSYRFSTVEIMFSYDYAKMLYTSAELYVNGTSVGTLDITENNCGQINWFRLFTCWTADNGMAMKSLSVVSGCMSLYESVTTELVGYQATPEDTANNVFNIRLVAVLTDSDLTKYDNVGFKVTASYINNGETVTMTLPDELGVCTSVYKEIIATQGCESLKSYSAEELGGEYIFALNCLNVPSNSGEIAFTVTTYYTLSGQNSVDETTVEFTVDPANDIPKGEVN